ncbi:hypothetical protein DM01DRAFT_22761, partial [Hesseltinella vesiculosa]
RNFGRLFNAASERFIGRQNVEGNNNFPLTEPHPRLIQSTTATAPLAHCSDCKSTPQSSNQVPTRRRPRPSSPTSSIPVIVIDESDDDESESTSPVPRSRRRVQTHFPLFFFYERQCLLRKNKMRWRLRFPMTLSGAWNMLTNSLSKTLLRPLTFG